MYAALRFAAEAGEAQVTAMLIESISATQPQPASLDSRQGRMRQHVLQATYKAVATHGLDTCCRLLLKHHPQLATREASAAPICEAAAKGHAATVCYILDAFHAPSQANDHRHLMNKALEAAACKGYIVVMQILIARGADINSGSDWFMSGSPLAGAIDSGRMEVVQFLLDSGASVHGFDEYPSALSYAVQGCHSRACQILLRHSSVTVGAGELEAAVYSGDGSLVQMVLEAEPRMDQLLRHNDGRRAQCLAKALRSAVARRSRDMVEALLNLPAHWGPITREIINEGLQEVIHKFELGRS
jgi:hypothetical protein